MSPKSGTGSIDVYDEVTRRINDGRIRSGERIVEERLADEVGVSRTPIREALTTLMAEGQVRRTRSGWELVEYSVEELEDAYEVRASLESLAAYCAASFGSTVDHARVQRANAAMERAAAQATGGDHFQFAQTMARLNSVFHAAIVRGSRNTRIPLAMRVVVVRPLVFSAFAWYSPDEVRQSNEFHATIARAISNRDSRRAERLMSEHIMRGRDVVLTHLRDGSMTDGDQFLAAEAWDRLLGEDGGAETGDTEVS